MPQRQLPSMSRRRFLLLSGAAGLGSAALLGGCAVNPVTGRQQFMLMSEQEEIAIDRQQSPHQFSADYGAVQDAGLQNYLAFVGGELTARTQRPHMPYSFRAVNANYVNAYAFPGGSIAITRGILIALDNEAELAGLLGHELGHINARHTAASMSKGTLMSAALGGVGLVAGQIAGKSAVGDMVQKAGEMGGQMLLASYSRDNERQADDLAMQYMVAANYSAQGMVGLMDMLRSLNRETPSALQLMFSTHPMSDERFAAAERTAQTRYAHSLARPVQRERYMDKTARLRAIANTIRTLEQGEQLLAQKNVMGGEAMLARAVQQSPDDYCARVILAKCLMMQDKVAEAQPHLEKATTIYPAEAQAHNLLGMSYLQTRKPERALAQFKAYDALMPGHPGTAFLQGFSHEMMGQKAEAAGYYQTFLKQVRQGDQAQHAYGRLVQWGYL